MKLDYLFIGAHPDDCEISCAGTILHLKELGHKVGICDLTEGEGGTYGSISDRRMEKGKASKLLNLDHRSCLEIADGHIALNELNRVKVINEIRKTKPEMVVTFIPPTRHPDHHHCALLVKEAVFLAGLTNYGLGQEQNLGLGVEIIPDAHRPGLMFFEEPITQMSRPDFVIDISKYFEKKVEVIKCFNTQVKVDETDDDQDIKTFIKSSRFWQGLRSKNGWYGMLIDADYGEGFFTDQILNIENPIQHLIKKFK